MPYIKIMNLSNDKAVKVAKNVIGDIAKISEVDESKFHFFNCGDSIFENGTDSLVYIEIVWYARSTAQMQSVAKLFCDEIKKHGSYYNVSVVFRDIPPLNNHYINGEQYKRPQNWKKPKFRIDTLK